MTSGVAALGLATRRASVEAWVADLRPWSTPRAGPLLAARRLGGAAVALAYAARHPERLTHLILYGGSARGRTRVAQAAFSRRR